jgi:hypothetical protein
LGCGCEQFPSFLVKMMSFGIEFSTPKAENMSYLCIELNLSRTDLLLQLKISHGLVDIDVIDKILNVRLLYMYLSMTCNLVAFAIIF